MAAGNITSIALARNVPAWHGLGVKVPGMMSAEDALKLGDLAWTVERHPLFVNIGGKPVLAKDPNNADGTEGKQPFALVRMDRNIVLTTDVTKRYKILQNSNAARIVDTLGGGRRARFETCGTFDYGKRVWFLVELDCDDEFNVLGDRVTKYLLIVNGHNGKDSLILCVTPVRVVCQNTLNLALKTAERFYKVRHVGENMDVENIQAAASEILGVGNDYFAEFRDQATALALQKVSRSELNTLLDNILFPMAENPSPRGKTMVEKARDLVLKCIAQQDLNDYRGTAWGVFNAVADYSDHHRIIKGVTKDQTLALERGFTRTFEDIGLKDRTLEYLRAIA